ncbi:type VI secretion system accessory protein TagJ [Stenotrophomonas sp. SY1]|uniref:type VI secretion system accessory protein TagJ n=1 Tax=Stenotrophomonas sp. SY1 TaxID=477235 RepID=UPI001E393508|nr:type VI secretion system accessory protein TagJ [Stenotrophomonas sp. SY1]MCD9087852.1 virulence protein SciE type [Stenotrophomonas sp. SY1]
MSIQLTSGPVATTANEAAALLRAGQLDQALQALTARVRSAPGDANERVFMFQMLAVLGQWGRAGEQLRTAVQLDPSLALLATTCEVLLRAEDERAAVFAGQNLPHVLGSPEPWLALLLQALQLEQQGQPDAAAALREQALEQAPAVPGTLDGTAFDWLGDADSRFGPCLEVISHSGYAWVPMAQLRELRIDAPGDLRDTVWLPGELVWANGAQTVVFLPVRYPGSEGAGEDALKLARRTEWDDAGHGVGQRMFATDGGEHALLNTRVITFDAAA